MLLHAMLQIWDKNHCKMASNPSLMPSYIEQEWFPPGRERKAFMDSQQAGLIAIYNFLDKSKVIDKKQIEWKYKINAMVWVSTD